MDKMLKKVGPISNWNPIDPANPAEDAKSLAEKFDVDVRTGMRWRKQRLRPVYAGDKPGRKSFSYWDRALPSVNVSALFLNGINTKSLPKEGPWRELILKHRKTLPMLLQVLTNGYQRKQLIRLLTGYCEIIPYEIELCLDNGVLLGTSSKRFAKPGILVEELILAVK